MRIAVLLVFGALLTHGVYGQYWFGPKVGINRSNFIYQNEDYAEDEVKVDPSLNFEVGAVVIYQASDLFSVHGEIYFEQVKKDLVSRIEDVNSSVTNRFIGVPMLFRMTFGKTPPVHYYVDGGIKMRFWTGGKGQIYGGASEFDDPALKYDKVVFKQSKSDVEGGVVAIRQANNMQFGLAVGGGLYLDLISNGRLLFDVKYVFGHSNMGFNDNPDMEVGVTGYVERQSYRNNTLSVSVAYLFQFDQQLQRKGKSTSSQTKRTKRK